MKKLLKVGLDWDDTLCPFVTNAITLCNMENETEFTLDDITEWGNKSPATKWYSLTILIFELIRCRKYQRFQNSLSQN